MNSSWLIPLATGLLGGTGVAGILGVFVNRQQNRMVNNATTVSQVIDGLKTIADERAADLAAARTRIAALEADLAKKNRRGT